MYNIYIYICVLLEKVPIAQFLSVEWPSLKQWFQLGFAWILYDKHHLNLPNHQVQAIWSTPSISIGFSTTSSPFL